MSIFYIEYRGLYETMTVIVDRDSTFDFIKETVIAEVHEHIALVKKDQNETIPNSRQCRYFTKVHNEYTRLLFALEYVYNIRDMENVPYMSVSLHTVHKQQK